MKKCSFCAEDIQDEAIKCRYCGEWLETEVRPVREPYENKTNASEIKKWAGRNCPDGTCIGRILATGRCSECGLTINEAKEVETTRPDSAAGFSSAKWGDLNSSFICPHCDSKGTVYCKSVKRKKGISGGKAWGTLWTVGASSLVTGLSRKEGLTQAHCSNCNLTWDF